VECYNDESQEKSTVKKIEAGTKPALSG